jgi:alanine racemase
MARRIAAHPLLRLVVVNAHPTLRDATPDAVVQEQFRRFCVACAGLDDLGGVRPLRLFASSRILARGAGMELDAVDPGQFLYADAEQRPGIRALTSRLLQVRAVTRDFGAEYAPFPLAGVTRIGVFPFGSVDGGGRCHTDHVLVRGRMAKLLGQPGLEYMRVDLTQHPDAMADDEVVLIGRQGSAAITLAAVCAANGHCAPSDIALTIGPAVLRTWLPASAAAPIASMAKVSVP